MAVAGKGTGERGHKGVKLKVFKGVHDSQNPQAWWNKLENEFQLNGLSTIDKQLPVIYRHLEGDAQVWYEELARKKQRRKGPLSSLDRLKVAFLDRYAPMENKIVQEQQWEARKMRYGESVDSYISEVITKGHALGASEKQQMKRLVAGLLPHYRRSVMLQNPKDLATTLKAIHRAVALEDACGKMASGVEQTGESGETLSDLSKLLKKTIRGEFKKVKEPKVATLGAIGGAGPSAPPSQPQVSNRDPATMRCFQCGQLGHLRRNCPQKPSGNRGNCFECGSDRHFARDCPRRKGFGRGGPNQNSNSGFQGNRGYYGGGQYGRSPMAGGYGFYPPQFQGCPPGMGYYEGAPNPGGRGSGGPPPANQVPQLTWHEGGGMPGRSSVPPQGN